FAIQSLIAATARIMSLRDAYKKMSKSDPIERSRLGILDSDEEIVEKLKRAKTDSIQGVSYDRTQRPEVANLLDIFSGFAERPAEEIAREYERADMAQFKKALTDVVISHLRPIRQQIHQYEGATTSELILIVRLQQDPGFI